MGPSGIARVIVAAAFLGLYSPAPAEACDCSVPGAACSAFQHADVVFSGRVLSLDFDASTPDAGSRVVLQVLESFRGVTAGQITIGAGMGNCAYPFRAGEAYFVYASRRTPKGMPLSGLCTRTAPLALAAADVSYSRSLRAISPAIKGQIGGSVVRWDRDLAGGSGAVVPLAHIPVIATGEGGTFSGATNESGEFVIRNVPRGRYDVRADVPDTMTTGSPQPFTVTDPRGCGGVRITAQYDGRVAGRVVSASGAGIPGLSLELVSEKRPHGDSNTGVIHARTGDDGSFEFEAVPPGAFLIAVARPRSARGVLSARPYFPGVDTAARAQIIAVGPAERVVLPAFTMPERFRYVTVTGVVLDVDGKPVQGAEVHLRGNETGITGIIGARIVTGEDGRFVAGALEGCKYDVHVSRSVRDARSRTADQQVGIVPFTAAAAMSPLQIVIKSDK